METPKFIQIHTLTSYPAALLNRDDAGFAKRIPFGGTSRTRVSSQCLKYHWRNFKGEHALYDIEVGKSFRSRETLARKLAQSLVNEGYPEKIAVSGIASLKEALLSGKKLTEDSFKKIIQAETDDELKEARKSLHTNQLTVFGEPEIKYLKQVVKEKLDHIKDSHPDFWVDVSTADKKELNTVLELLNDYKDNDLKKNLKGLQVAAGLDAAMFGRMVTSDFLARGDAAIHVAHAFTTHEEESESDYFSAVDELRRDEPEESGELGAGHINSTELNSGLFYSYVVIDLPQLVSNLEGVNRDSWLNANRELAAEVLQRMVHLIATVTPGAKLGSTAPYAYAQCVMVETGNAQPRSFANAFQKAVPHRGEGVLENSFKALSSFLADMDAMYENTNKRKVAAIGPKDILLGISGIESSEPLSAISNWVASLIKGDVS
jgi:CRISPR system Cascade subunit CasC